MFVANKQEKPLAAFKLKSTDGRRDALVWWKTEQDNAWVSLHLKLLRRGQELRIVDNMNIEGVRLKNSHI